MSAPDLRARMPLRIVPDLFGDDRLIQHARSVVARAALVLPPADPEADAATDRFLAQVYAAEGRRPLMRRGPA